MQPKKADLEKAREIKEFLAKNYRNHFDYDDLVQRFAMNEFKMKVAFKALTNGNVHEYVTKIRIEHAKALLENTDLTISTIANKIGLDRSNFNIQFKKLTGKTPSEWRKDPDSSDGDFLKSTGT